MRSPTSYAALALSWMLAAGAHAWPSYQQPLVLGTGSADTPVAVCADGAGGTFIAWPASATPPNSVFQLVHLDSTGAPAPGWTFAGVHVCSLGVAVSPLHLRLLRSTGGGAILVWDESSSITLTDLRTYAARVTSSGTLAPGWNPRGLPLSTVVGQLHLSACADGAGGLLAVWEQPVANQPSVLRAQRLLANGTRPAGWTALGRNLTTLLVGPGVRQPSLVADPAGGYWVGFGISTADSTLTPASVQVLHLTSSGTVDPNAPTNGFSLTLPSILAQPWGGDVTIVPDGLGGAYVGVVATDNEMFVQHGADASGEDSNWPPGGIVVSSQVSWPSNFDFGYDPQQFPVSSSDGHGGAWFGWGETNGSRWAENHLVLARVHDAGGPVIDVPPLPASGGRYPMLLGDANGVFATGWNVLDCPQQGNCFGVPYLGRFTTGGAVATGWPPASDFVPPGVPLSGPNDSRHSVMTADGTGSVVVAWGATSPLDGRPGRYVNRFRPVLDATLAVPADRREGRVRLGAVWRTGAVLHATAQLGIGPAALEVFDLSGRRLAGTTIAGTGREMRYELSLDHARASGLVFVRVRQGDAQAARRLVILR